MVSLPRSTDKHGFFPMPSRMTLASLVPSEASCCPGAQETTSTLSELPPGFITSTFMRHHPKGWDEIQCPEAVSLRRGHKMSLSLIPRNHFTETRIRGRCEFCEVGNPGTLRSEVVTFWDPSVGMGTLCPINQC